MPNPLGMTPKGVPSAGPRSFLEPALNAIIPSAAAADTANQLQFKGANISKEQAISDRARYVDLLRKNEDQLRSVPPEMRPAMEKMNAFARKKLESDIRELDGILQQKFGVR